MGSGSQGLQNCICVCCKPPLDFAANSGYNYSVREPTSKTAYIPRQWRRGWQEWFASEPISEKLRYAVEQELADPKSKKALTRRLIDQAFGFPKIESNTLIDIQSIVLGSITRESIDAVRNRLIGATGEVQSQARAHARAKDDEDAGTGNNIVQ